MTLPGQSDSIDYGETRTVTYVTTVNLQYAADAYRQARKIRDRMVAQAVEQGMLPRDVIARAVGLSRSRVDQIARGE